MTHSMKTPPGAAAPDYDSTLFVSLELSRKHWKTAAQIPGVEKHSLYGCEADPQALLALLEKMKARAGRAGKTVVRVVLVHESGRDGFWLARWLIARGVEVHVMHAASLPVDRRMRRVKTDAIDAECLLRALLAFLRGEPRVCAMAPIPTPQDEDARRAHREREQLIEERKRLTNQIGAVLAMLGVADFEPLRRGARERLAGLRQPDGSALPRHARAALERMLERLDCARRQIATLEKERDEVLKKQTPADAPQAMIRALARLVGVGAQSASLLTREAFVRDFANRRALGQYAGLAGTPHQSGGSRREKGVSKAGNARLREAMIELAWLWLRHQPKSALTLWFRKRVGDAEGGVRKTMIVALARKLLVALWKLARLGEAPRGATMKAR
mgnify:CR=1 FL=1